MRDDLDPMAAVQDAAPHRALEARFHHRHRNRRDRRVRVSRGQPDAFRAHHDQRGITGAKGRGIIRQVGDPAPRQPNRNAFSVPRLDADREEVGRTEKGRHERVGRRAVDLFGRAHLLDPAAAHHGQPVGHPQRLFLIMRDEDERDVQLALNAFQLALHLLAQTAVECAERLVEQQGAREVDQRARQRHALALSPGQRGGPARGTIGEAHDLQHRAHTVLDLGARQALRARTERNVVEHGQMREQRVVLKDRVDVAPVGRHAGHIDAVQPDVAATRLVEPADEPQQRRLAAARRAENREELTASHREARAFDGHHRAEPLVYVRQRDHRRCIAVA